VAVIAAHWELLLLGVAELVSLGCVIVLWRSAGSVARKLVWTPIVAIPVFGPVLFGGLYEVPSRQREVDQAPPTDAA
jgi:hypothetical protein